MKVKNLLLKVNFDYEHHRFSGITTGVNVPLFGQLHVIESDPSDTIILVDKIQFNLEERRKLLDNLPFTRWVRISGEVMASGDPGAGEILEGEKGEDAEIFMSFTLYATHIEFVSDHEVEQETN